MSSTEEFITPSPSLEDKDWHGPSLYLSKAETAWIMRLVCEDMAKWTDAYPHGLDRHRAIGLALFLGDFLPADIRTEILSSRNLHLKAG